MDRGTSGTGCLRQNPVNNAITSRCDKDAKCGTCSGVPQCRTCLKNAAEILKIKGDHPKVNKSGLKRTAEG
jgi:hypothetical protein